MRLKYAALVIIGDNMSKYFDLINHVLTSVFMDLNNPFTIIFGCFFVLVLIIFISILIFGDR